MSSSSNSMQHEQQQQQVSVQEALVLMQEAVRSGDLQKASAIGGTTACIPLNVGLDQLALLGELACGAEASVLYGSHAGRDVAVKRFKIGQSDDLKRFRRELSILASLAGHPNIVPLVAARALPPDYLIVMPLAATTLHAKLYTVGWRPSAAELLGLALQAAKGLAAVHAAGLVHRDIKPSNMLLTDEGQLWLADFGLAASAQEVVQESTLSLGMVRSRGKPTGGFMRRAVQGTLEYMAPEVLQKQPASAASDVYALAIAINELATGVYPFSDCTKDNPDIHTVLEHGYGRMELATAVAAEGLRPMLPRHAPPGLVQLLQAAWSLDPAARPTVVQMRDALAAMQQQELQRQQPEAKGKRVSDGSSCGESLTAMELDGEQQQQVVLDLSSMHAARGALSSCSSELDLQQLDSDTVVSESMSAQLTPGGSKQQARRPPWRTPSSLSTVSTEPTAVSFSSAARPPLSTEAANAAAAAAAAAAVPAAASLRGVLSQAAAAAPAPALVAAANSTKQQQRVEAGAFSALGPRESNEDRHVVVQGLGGDSSLTLAAVFDGHRGHEAAAYAAAQLPRHLLVASVQVASGSSGSAIVAGDAPTADSRSEPSQALRQAFLATDAGFLQDWQAGSHTHAAIGQYAERYPGCTALAVVVAGQQLFVANAGDSRAVLSRGGVALPLSRQHTADLEDERARVVAAGGSVVCRGGSWRVGPAALQVTRALGDFDLKLPPPQHTARLQQRLPPRSPYAAGGSAVQHSSSASALSGDSSSAAAAPLPQSPALPVTADPEVVSARLSASDEFLILGTDGLWDVLADQEAVGLVQDTVKDPALCAKRLVQEALARGSNDNVTAVVVFLQPRHTLERVWMGSSGRAVPAATPTFYGSRRPTTPALQEQQDAAAGAGADRPSACAADEIMETAY